MRKVYKKSGLVVVLMALGFVLLSAGLAFANSHGVVADPARLLATNIPTATAIGNITLVGIAMIGVVLAKFGIKAAKSMIN